ncbi:MAG: glycosyltransferase [Flavisolibacter sp.]|nr:glycosyltransferase [Flavisolibacter sp.]
MNTLSNAPSPSLVSVIIPCYNQGQYLAKAIESVLAQSHKDYEIIVVDDGSTDHTKEVAAQYSVKYIYQSNKGPSAARNKGIHNSSGNYIVFLDADDWLLPDAFSINLSYLVQHPEAAFVSGAHKVWYEPQGKVWEVKKEVRARHYCRLLEGNFIGTPGVIMFRRWIFNHFRFDASLRACEDYKLYLRITRKFSVIHHTSLLTVYRIHETNATNNARLLLKAAIHVLRQEKRFLRTHEEKQCWQRGMDFWKTYYTEKIYNQLIYELYHFPERKDKKGEKALKRYHPQLYLKYISERNEIRKEQKLKKRIESRNRIKARLKKILPAFIIRLYKRIR